MPSAFEMKTPMSKREIMAAALIGVDSGSTDFLIFALSEDRRGSVNEDVDL